MTYYLLQIESNLVTLAFTSLPNTAVRKIIHNLSDKNNNNKAGPENNSHNVFLATAENNTNDTIQMYMIFFLSMAMVLFDDQTEQRQIEAKILAEKKKITEMLSKVLPKNSIEELQKGSDSIALSVQFASIRCIEVCST